MTYEEAIAIEHEITRMLVANVKAEHKDRVFTAHKMAIESLEKQIPMKPKEIKAIDSNDNAVVECVCGATQEVAVKSIKSVYCWRCGQRLDWSDIPDWEEIDWSFIGVEAE